MSRTSSDTALCQRAARLVGSGVVLVLLGAVLLHAAGSGQPSSGQPAAGDEAASWQEVLDPPKLVFPRDHGSHPAFRTEWWYVTGLVAPVRPDGAVADQSRRLGFQITFFRRGVAPGPGSEGASPLRARQIMAAHLAVADLAGQRLVQAERLRRIGGGLAGAEEQDLEVWVDDWTLRRRKGDLLEVHAVDGPRGAGLELTLRPTRRLVRHGDGGLSRKGAEAGNASVYLSWTRLEVCGRVRAGGQDGPWVEVAGTAWLDHEWGTSQLGRDVIGWDWLSLRLDDGRDLMVYLLRRADGTPGPYSSGTLVAPDGDTVHTVRLAPEQIVLEPTGHWTSPASGALYPSGWSLRVPAHGIELTVHPLLADAELDGRGSTGVIYWEGPVEARTAGGLRAGEGYVELTGYAGTLGGRL